MLRAPSIRHSPSGSYTHELSSASGNIAHSTRRDTESSAQPAHASGTARAETRAANPVDLRQAISRSLPRGQLHAARLRTELYRFPDALHKFGDENRHFPGWPTAADINLLDGSPGARSPRRRVPRFRYVPARSA